MDNPSAAARTFYVAIAATAGAAAGWIIGRGVASTTVGTVMGLAIAMTILVFRVRPLVALSVGVGAGVGAYIGGTIVGVLCEPQGCPAFEASAALVTGIGALVGVGLVVALATRSFDEYREATAEGRNPPTTGCSPDSPRDSD